MSGGLLHRTGVPGDPASPIHRLDPRAKILGFAGITVVGVSTPLLTLIAIGMRLNLPAIQLVNYLASPLQLLLIIPFVRVGEWLVGAPRQPLTVAAGLDILAQGAWQAIVVLWDAIVHAAIGWIVIGPVLILALHRIFQPLLTRAAARAATQNRPESS